MFRIRRIYDTNTPVNQKAVACVQQILRDQFALISTSEVDQIPDVLRDPLKHRFRSVLFVADNMKGEILGFALLMHATDLDFCYLDYISTTQHMSGRGWGGALYQRVREEAVAIKAKGLFFECLPDDPALCADASVLQSNRARLKFYERYGARPLVHTAYETPVTPGGDNPPYLVVDTLDRQQPFSKDEMRLIVRAILERKYSKLCDHGYVDRVTASITDDPVCLRPFRYLTEQQAVPVRTVPPEDKLIALTFDHQHTIHHVKERGYVESPVRVTTILSSILKTGMFRSVPVRHYGDSFITAVHGRAFFEYLRRVCESVPEGESVYPYVFPIRNNARPPKDLAMRAGYYCIDTFTPLNKNAYLAARSAVDCALSAAHAVLEGAYLAYALVRPPGHHAEPSVFGGFCYFNSTAIAAQFLSQHGKVAILDVDYHHGNGQQMIFYRRRDVLTLSIHGHPRFAYPFFSGYAEECGEGDGDGFSRNYPLPETITAHEYLETLKKALAAIERFKPTFLVVALGLDTARGDPTGTWCLDAKDFEQMGRLIGALPHPTLFVQEGGYKTKTIGRNARHFFQGVWDGAFA